MYNIKGSDVEEYVEDYLAKRGVNGVSEVKVRVRSEGKVHPEVAIYLFMNQDSKFISSEMNNVPAMLRNKVDNKVNMKLTDEFRKILYPLCGNEIRSGKAENREYFVKLDIFRAVGMMFSVNPNRHSLVITDAKNIPGGSLISIVKNEKFFGSSGNKGDNRARQIDNLERR